MTTMSILDDGCLFATRTEQRDTKVRQQRLAFTTLTRRVL